MRRCLLYLLFSSTVLFISNFAYAQSDASSLPWCRQPSEVRLEATTSYGYTYTTSFGAGPDGIRPVYQEYNQRIILMTSDTRDVVQVIEEGIDVNEFDLLGYSSDCRYMAAALRANDGRFETVIWDLSTHPATRLGSFDDGVGSSHRLDWSPDGRFVIVSTRNAAYLWNLASNTQTRLSTDVISDCSISLKGCDGTLFAHAGVEWDAANGVVRVNLNQVGYTVAYDLNTGQPVTVTERDGQPAAEAESATMVEWLESSYGCIPRVHYQTYNQRLVLKDWITGELLEVIEENLNLVGFQFHYWSATCQYIVAAIDAGAGLELVAWNIASHARTSLPIPDYVDRFDWSPVGNIALVQTDGDGAFLWNIDTNQKTVISASVPGSRSIPHIWIANRNLLLAVTSSVPNAVTAFNIYTGQVVGSFDNNASETVGYSLLPGDQWLAVWSRFGEYASPEFSLWNLDDHSVVRLVSAISSDDNYYHSVRFSPNGRYLYQGWEFWDLQNLSGSEPHAPNYVVDFNGTSRMRFVDEHIVETSTVEVTAYDIARCQANWTLYQWDIRSGELLSERSELRRGC